MGGFFQPKLQYACRKAMRHGQRAAHGARACIKCSTREQRMPHAAKKAFSARKPMACNAQKTVYPVSGDNHWLSAKILKIGP